jgi:hypothetical protein
MPGPPYRGPARPWHGAARRRARASAPTAGTDMDPRALEMTAGGFAARGCLCCFGPRPGAAGAAAAAAIVHPPADPVGWRALRVGAAAGGRVTQTQPPLRTPCEENHEWKHTKQRLR